MSKSTTLELDRETVVRLRDAGKHHANQLEKDGYDEWALEVDKAVQELLSEWNKHVVKEDT